MVEITLSYHTSVYSTKQCTKNPKRIYTTIRNIKYGEKYDQSYKQTEDDEVVWKKWNVEVLKRCKKNVFCILIKNKYQLAERDKIVILF